MTAHGEYERLVAFTRLLWNVSELLAVKGHTVAADVLLAEAAHFAAERDLARRVAELDADLDNPVTTIDLGELPD